jgi:sugar lactone lactonase YvrE
MLAPMTRPRWFAVLAALAAATLAAAESREELRAAHARAREAYERKDYPAFLAESARVASLAPRSTRALYNLACAQALSGDAPEAVATLDRLATMGIDAQPARDGDLASLRERADFQAVLRRMEALQEPVGSSAVAFRLPEKDLLTEGIAYDPASGDFFVGSVHRGKLLRVATDGRSRDFVATGQHGLLAPLGLGVDAARRTLWVASASLPQRAGHRPEDAGRSRVLAFDLDSGVLKRSLGPPAAAPDARFGDLAVGPAGEVVASDLAAGTVYVLRPGSESFEVLAKPYALASPQGLAFSDDGRQLHVADYVRGIARVDLQDGAVRLLESASPLALTGIDGLVRHGDSLVAVQNGVLPHRILRLRLDAAGERIEEVGVLERGNPLWDEPTLGVRVGRDFHYVAASQWARFGDDGGVDEAALREPLVLKLSLAW